MAACQLTHQGLCIKLYQRPRGGLPDLFLAASCIHEPSAKSSLLQHFCQNSSRRLHHDLLRCDQNGPMRLSIKELNPYSRPCSAQLRA